MRVAPRRRDPRKKRTGAENVILELKQLFDIPGEELPFSYALDLTGYELYGVRPFAQPVSLTGRVRNAAGVVLLCYEASFTLRMPCDRCLEEFSRDYRLSFEEVLVLAESEEHDDYIVAPDARLDMDELALSDILLSLPYKQLCREDCKGLCPDCGANLNLTRCACGGNGAG